ncbi:MAG: hypothetical protein SPL79_10895 [Sphaerochaetaceae bacterium]|jgi:hypothetical protein|nr:hypothetical protein [Sphaerochaetaceae bacterium]
MKRLACLGIIGLLSLLPATAETVLSGTPYLYLDASVSGYLLHGFLNDTKTALRDTYSVDDALGVDGVDLPYTIETNKKASLTVYAVVTPFVQQNVANPSSIAVASLQVDGKEIYPETSRMMTNSNAASDEVNTVVRRDYGTESIYSLFSLDTVLGKTQYDYTIHVTANQNDVATAPAGHYVSSVTLSIETRN